MEKLVAHSGVRFSCTLFKNTLNFRKHLHLTGDFMFYLRAGFFYIYVFPNCSELEKKRSRLCGLK